MAVDWNTRAAWDASYNIGGEPWGHPADRPEVRLHYNRFVMQPALERRADRMNANVPGFSSVQDLFIIGGGFGWTAEYLRGLGKNVVVTDISDWILTTQGETEEGDLTSYIVDAGQDPLTFQMIGPDGQLHNPFDIWGRQQKALGDVIDEDLSTNTSRRNVRNQLQGMDTILTEGIIDGLDDPLSFIADVDALRRNPATVPVHMFTPGRFDGTQDTEGWNWRTPAQWRTLLNDNGFSDHRLLNMETLGLVT